MMSHSSTNLVFVQLDLSSHVQETTGYKDKLYLWPRQLDVKVKTCTLPIGAELAVFPQEQTVSGGVKVENCPSKRGVVCLPLSFPWSPCFCFLRLHLQMCSTGSPQSFMDGSRWQPLRLLFMFVLCSNTCRPTRTFRKLLRYLMHPSTPRRYVRLLRWQKCVHAGFGPTRAMSRICRQWTMTNLLSLATSLVYAKDEILKLFGILILKILRD